MSAVQIAFLTGRSAARSLALSPEQSAFLAALAGPGRELVRCNFPYAPGPFEFAATPLWLASLRNVREYLGARRAGFRARHLDSVTALLGRARHTVLLAGSCGLELLVSLRLPAAMLSTVSVFAYGAVARARPPCRCLLVRGGADWLAGLCGPRADRVTSGGHLGYLRRPEVLTLCREFVAAIERDGGSDAPDARWGR